MSRLTTAVDQVIKKNAELPAERQRAAVLEALGLPVDMPNSELAPSLREAVNEVFRRENMTLRRRQRKTRKEASLFGRCGEGYRRVIKVELFPPKDSDLEKDWKRLGLPGREIQHHATKGIRTYRRTL